MGIIGSCRVVLNATILTLSNQDVNQATLKTSHKLTSFVILLSYQLHCNQGRFLWLYLILYLNMNLYLYQLLGEISQCQYTKWKIQWTERNSSAYLQACCDDNPTMVLALIVDKRKVCYFVNNFIIFNW